MAGVPGLSIIIVLSLIISQHGGVLKSMTRLSNFCGCSVDEAACDRENATEACLNHGLMRVEQLGCWARYYTTAKKALQTRRGGSSPRLRRAMTALPSTNRYLPTDLAELSNESMDASPSSTMAFCATWWLLPDHAHQITKYR